MSFDELWGVGFGTIFALAILSGLFYFKRMLRNRLFPTEGMRGRGEAMTELLLLQAQLEEKAGLGNRPEGDEDETKSL
jgi:hypothetical protein